MKRKVALVVLLTILSAFSVLAEEGMWMPSQILDLAPQVKALGFEGDPQAFADLTGQPMGAIISLGGCSASFVSPGGLIVTNHHCALSALQYNSRPEKNILEDGFLAKTRAEELPNGPGSRVYVTVSVKDITAEITGQIDSRLTDRQRFDLIEKRRKERVAACEKAGFRCSVPIFFEGLKYFEIAQLEIPDVRLVYAPAAGIGNFGGETDNWQWPRHTGDFTFLRAYVGKDGRPAPFSKDNVPFHPTRWIKIGREGVSPGDFIIVAGYPGNTNRLDTYREIRETVEWVFPRAVRRAQDQIAILEKLAQTDKELALKVATRIRYLHNGLTNRIGKLAGFRRGDLLKQKEAEEQALRAWIAGDSQRQQKYGDVFPGLDALFLEGQKTKERDQTLGALVTASTLLGAADNSYRLALEKAKPDSEREAEFQQRNWLRIREKEERGQRSFDPRADRALLRYVLLEVAGLPAGQRIIPLDREIGLVPGLAQETAAKAIDAYLDRLYAGTKLGDVAVRLGLLDKTASEIEKMDDPFVKLALLLHPLNAADRERKKELAGRESRLRPRYMEAMLTMKGGLLAPDANGTLRITYGTVKPVSPKDGLLFNAQTTLEGILEKNTGSGEFHAPAREIEAIKTLRAGKKTPFVDPKLGDVPVDFLATVDTTGGNSGSAALNRRGELVGLLFDGTFDTVASDIVFDKVNTRSILLDIRYLLWVAAEVDQADNVLAELGIR